MKIRCIYRTGKDLRPYEYSILEPDVFGRFGACEYSEYGQIEVNRDYLVMGMILYKSYLAYIIDDNGWVSALPCQLFEVLDNSISPNWYFRLIDKSETIYPYIQSIWGYYELCFEDNHISNLLVEHTLESENIYQKRKKEMYDV